MIKHISSQDLATLGNEGGRLNSALYLLSTDRLQPTI